MSLVKATAFNDTSESGNAVLYGVAAAQGGMNFRNRIINGDMRIDQRNAGAAVTFNVAGTYLVDRWTQNNPSGATITGQQSTTAPSGFVNSMLITATSGGSSTAANLRVFRQFIEGLNIADLAWGTASAKAVTLSFWIRSNVTGTFACYVSNSAANRSQVQTFTISVADTWEYKTVTFAGDTSGTWLTTNGVGIELGLDLGSGSNYNATAGVWNASYNTRTSGSVNWSTTTNNNIYITGVQLEVGTVATPFERRPYGTELALCQRYYWKFTASAYAAPGFAYDTTAFIISGIRNPVPMRADPTLTIPSASANFTGLTGNGANPSSYGTYATEAANTQYVGIRGTGFGASYTVGQVSYLSGNNTQHLQVSAEL